VFLETNFWKSSPDLRIDQLIGASKNRISRSADHEAEIWRSSNRAADRSLIDQLIDQFREMGFLEMRRGFHEMQSTLYT